MSPNQRKCPSSNSLLPSLIPMHHAGKLDILAMPVTAFKPTCAAFYDFYPTYSLSFNLTHRGESATPLISFEANPHSFNQRLTNKLVSHPPSPPRFPPLPSGPGTWHAYLCQMSIDRQSDRHRSFLTLCVGGWMMLLLKYDMFFFLSCPSLMKWHELVAYQYLEEGLFCRECISLKPILGI